MKYLNNYLIFESVQQFDKLMKNYMNNNPNYDNDGLYKLKDKLQSEGLIAYLGPLTKIILGGYDTDFFEEDVDDIIDGIKFLKKNNIDIAKLDIQDIYEFSDAIYELEQELLIKKYITRWAPASLRKEALSLWEKFRIYLTKIENDTIPEDLLKKGSRFKNGKEWIDYIITLFNGNGYELDRLKNSNIKIYFEDDTVLIYKPLDFKSYMLVNYQHWCTMQKVMFDNYLKQDMIICLNKKDITKSIISYVSGNKIEIFNYGNYFINNKIPEESKEYIDIMKSNHKLKKDDAEMRTGGFFMFPADFVKEGFFDTKFTGSEDAIKWNKLVEKNKSNFENFIGFLVSNLFDVYDIYEKKTAPLIKTGSAYWYGPMYVSGHNGISRISMYIEQIDDESDIFNALQDIKESLVEISGLDFKLEKFDYVDDENGLVKTKLVITFDLKPNKIKKVYNQHMTSFNDKQFNEE